MSLGLGKSLDSEEFGPAVSASATGNAFFSVDAQARHCSAKWRQYMGSGIERPRKPVQLAMKRAFDIGASIVLMVFFLPIFLLIGLLVWIDDPGAIFFAQHRVGLNNSLFKIWKFRTMRTSASDMSGVRQTVSEDPRTTRVGRILRKSNLDELPQLWNIFVGEMSFVGPRPHVEQMLAGGRPYEDLVPGYRNRHAMRPGLTGLAQCRGLRGPTSDPRRAKLRVLNDIVYIRRFSISLDIVIILRTLRNEIGGGTGL